MLAVETTGSAAVGIVRVVVSVALAMAGSVEVDTRC